MSTAEIAKFNMIEQQIRPWEVLDNNVLSTLNNISREDFVVDAYKGLAYADCQIPVGEGIRMLNPIVEGRLLQALQIEPDDEVLEIGCSSGYLTACLARLAKTVDSIDTSEELITTARNNVTAYALSNINFQQTNTFSLDRSQAYDVIAVTGSVATVPENLKQALKVGGRMFIVAGSAPVMQALLITRVYESEWITQSIFETDLPRLHE